MDELRQLVDTWRQKKSTMLYLRSRQLLRIKRTLVAVSRKMQCKGIKSRRYHVRIAPAIRGGGGGRPDIRSRGKETLQVPTSIRNCLKNILAK